MKSFIQIATPHKDVTSDQLTMDMFAADLWAVVKGTAPKEYQDPDMFFNRTYETKALKDLQELVQRRLEGKGEDAVINLQTSFGGGKTHLLIALYHRAKEWGANVVVIDGVNMSPGEQADKTFWGVMEKQLTGKIKNFNRLVAPGKEEIVELFENYTPLLILMDEVSNYASRARGVKVGESNLATQTVGFIQPLTEAVKAVPNCILVVTLPESIGETVDEEIHFQLEKAVGRVAEHRSPIEDEEVSSVITKRLFTKVDTKSAKTVIDEYIRYIEKERLIESNLIEKHREAFEKSYPFHPETIEYLYSRWSSLSKFQRTRGVLRLLALVVKSLQKSTRPYIRFADFDLSDDKIKDELINYLDDSGYDAVIREDITSPNSPAKRIDSGLGDSYLPYKFGTAVATSIFMLYPPGHTKDVNITVVKRSSAELSVESSIIDTVLNKLKTQSYYISDEGLFYTKEPNLNKMHIGEQANIRDEAIVAEEKDLLKGAMSKEKLMQICVWPESSKDIPDTEELTLVILKDRARCKEFFENYGGQPRVNKNRLIFLCPDESQEVRFKDFLRKKLAWERILNKPGLTNDKKKIVQSNIDKCQKDVLDELQNYYRIVLLPTEDEFESLNLGRIEIDYIDTYVYETLKNKEKILTNRIAPRLILERFLKDRDYLETNQLYKVLCSAPGQFRPANREVLRKGISEGVQQGLFGLGHLEGDVPVCDVFKETPNVAVEEGEVIIKAELCKPKLEEGFKEVPTGGPKGSSDGDGGQPIDESGEDVEKREYDSLCLKLKVPIGSFSSVNNIAGYLARKFGQVDIEVTITTKDGKLTRSEYEDKIEETIKQDGIEIISFLPKTQ